MEFTYQAPDRTWNPETHTYEENGAGTWSANDADGSSITVRNTGTESVAVRFQSVPTAEGTAVSGRFVNDAGDVDSIRLEKAQEESVRLELSGALPKDCAGLTIGSIIVTIAG